MSVLPEWVKKGTELEMKVTDSGVELGWTDVTVVRVNKNKIVLEFAQTDLSDKHSLTGKSIRLDLRGETRSDRDDWNPSDFRAKREEGGDVNEEQAAQIEELRKALAAVQTHVKELEEKEEEEPEEDEKDEAPSVKFCDVDGDMITVALSGADLSYSCNGNLRIAKVERIEVKAGKYGPRTMFFFHNEGTKWRFTAAGKTTMSAKWVYNTSAYKRLEAFATMAFVDYIDDTEVSDDDSSDGSSESESDSSDDDDKKEKRRARKEARKGRKGGKGGRRAERMAARKAKRAAAREGAAAARENKEAKLEKLKAHREELKGKIGECKEKMEKFNAKLEKFKGRKENVKAKKEKFESKGKKKKVQKMTKRLEKIKGKLQKFRGKKQKTRKEIQGYRQMIKMANFQIKALKKED